MSEEGNNETTEGQGGHARLFGIITLAGVGLLLLISLVSLVLVIGVMSELSTLGEQTRKAAKANKALQEEVAALKEAVHPSAPRPAVQKVEAAPEPKPTAIDSADPSQDCVIRAGDKSGVANCMGIDLKGKVK